MADSSRIADWTGDFLQAPLVRGLRIQFRIIGALMMREAMTRFGRENIGFMWLMVEPLILTIGVMIIWTFAKGGHGAGGQGSNEIGVIPFVLSGYIMLTLWRHITGRAALIFRRNAALLFHRRIHFIDPLISSTLLEAVGVGTAFFVAYIPLFLFDQVEPINDPLLLVGSWLLMVWFSFGVALNIAALSEIEDVVEHFVQPFMYLILPLSGAFFMIEWLPSKYQKLVLLAPLAHLHEMFRDGMFGHKIECHWNFWYIAIWCIALTTAGYLLAGKARKHIRFD